MPSSESTSPLPASSSSSASSVIKSHSTVKSSHSASSSLKLPSSTPAASNVTATNASNNTQSLALGLSLGIIGLLLVIGIVVYTKRLHRRLPHTTLTSPDQLPSHRCTVVVEGSSHLATKITPFGRTETFSGREPPGYAFGHEPGQNMRTAIRRPDGSWEFADSRTIPFHPHGVSDLDAIPSSASSASLISYSSYASHSTASLLSPQQQQNGSGSAGRTVERVKKEDEARRYRAMRKEWAEFDAAADSVVVPPPAYGSEPL